ncbi:RRM protein [Ceratobasidium sp. 395]|nr:RRM protein [Ceratobasidium sp. 395]
MGDGGRMMSMEGGRMMGMEGGRVLGVEGSRVGGGLSEGARLESARALLGVLNSADPYNTTVFVGGLSGLIAEDTLRSFFVPFGEIHYVKIPPGKGCGFVQFVRKADAERAIERMQGYPIGGGKIRLSWGRSQSDKAAQAAAQAAQLGLNLGGLHLNSLSAADSARLFQTLEALGYSSVPSGALQSVGGGGSGFQGQQGVGFQGQPGAAGLGGLQVGAGFQAQPQAGPFQAQQVGSFQGQQLGGFQGSQLGAFQSQTGGFQAQQPGGGGTFQAQQSAANNFQGPSSTGATRFQGGNSFQFSPTFNQPNSSPPIQSPLASQFPHSTHFEPNSVGMSRAYNNAATTSSSGFQPFSNDLAPGYGRGSSSNRQSLAFEPESFGLRERQQTAPSHSMVKNLNLGLAGLNLSQRREFGIDGGPLSAPLNPNNNTNNKSNVPDNNVYIH